jgi:coatomer subunit beta'
VIGYDEGTIMIKIGREVPVASMDNSGKIIWAKHNEIQTVNIKTVGAGNEVLLVHNANLLKAFYRGISFTYVI